MHVLSHVDLDSRHRSRDVKRLYSSVHDRRVAPLHHNLEGYPNRRCALS